LDLKKKKPKGWTGLERAVRQSVNRGLSSLAAVGSFGLALEGL